MLMQSITVLILSASRNHNIQRHAQTATIFQLGVFIPRVSIFRDTHY